MTPYEHWSLIWAGTAAVVTVVTLLFVIIAALLTYRQVKESIKGRQLEGAQAIITRLTSPEFSSVRKIVRIPFITLHSVKK